jgi:hypothetical protein
LFCHGEFIRFLAISSSRLNKKRKTELFLGNIRNLKSRTANNIAEAIKNEEQAKKKE